MQSDGRPGNKKFLRGGVVLTLRAFTREGMSQRDGLMKESAL